MKLTGKSNDKSESMEEVKDSIKEAQIELSDDNLDHVSGGSGGGLNAVPGFSFIPGPIAQNRDQSQS